MNSDALQSSPSLIRERLKAFFFLFQVLAGNLNPKKKPVFGKTGFMGATTYVSYVCVIEE